MTEETGVYKVIMLAEHDYTKIQNYIEAIRLIAEKGGRFFQIFRSGNCKESYSTLVLGG